MRVPESLVERMLDLAGEAAIVLAQVQEQLRELGQTRHGVRDTAERLSQLGAELERVVDSRSVTLDVRATSREFDPLELDAFDELHTLTRRIAEVGADDKLLDRQLERQLATMNDSVGRLERVQTDLREAVVRSRMVPVGSIAARLQRAVRQAARIAGKSVAFELAGEEVGVDAQLLQSLVDPLTHLLRNAVDHGIEDPRTRLAAGKPEIGRVSLEFSRQGQNLSIACRDDGRGLDYDAIGARATELGLRPAQGSGEPGELANLILRPGFSTRRAATELSGRGIGLDVVASAVARLRGTLRVESAPGQGVSIGLAVPERIASLPVMVVRAGARVLALSIRGIESVGPAQTVPDAQDGAQTFWHEGAQLEVVRLDRALGLAAGSLQPGAQPGRALASAAPQEAPSEEVALIVARDDGARIVVVAPQASQPRSVVMRPLPAWFPRLPSIDGATVLGDGAVAAVIDLPSLLARGGAAVPAPEELAPPRLGPRCLVADDSVSVRRAMEAFLHDLGLEVDSASDGVEALEHFDRQAPDLAILDLEMPRMNGLELAGAIRERVAGKDVPLIMITSRSSDKHRAMARAAGVDVFMTKPYTEDDLASAIRQCLERGAPLG
ncbi:MAG TPA: response regulator [Burkholderiaceae bacterium]